MSEPNRGQSVRRENDGPEALVQQRPFAAGLDDFAIIPLAAMAYAIRTALRAVLRLLVLLLDVSFPIVLQIVRFPLFTLRIIGGGLAALARGVIALLPLGEDRRAQWRANVDRAWRWVRERISYKAFEEALHHLFEGGMVWVFRTCRTLSPRSALLVILGAIVWLPLSFGIATALHAILFAKATVWPAWVQLLHPLATVIAKSKLLVLPVYPAAWPQAKLHPVVQTLMAAARYLWTMAVVRKLVYRYRQAAYVAWIARRTLAGHAERAGAGPAWRSLLRHGNAAATATGAFCRRLLEAGLALLSSTPVAGDIVKRYAAHYEAAKAGAAQKPAKFSERMRQFYGRWSIKLSAEYYEQQDREQAEAAALLTSAPTLPASKT